MTMVVNIKRDEPYDVLIGRPSPFGNPFRIGPNGDRRDVIDQYRAWFYRRLATDADFREQVHALAGKRLGCYCAPALCHGDVIVEYLRGR